MPSNGAKAVREKLRLNPPWELVAEQWGVTVQTLSNWARGEPIVRCETAARFERVSVDDFRAGRFGPAFAAERKALLEAQQQQRTVQAIVQDAAATDDPELKSRKLEQAADVATGRAKAGRWFDARLTTSHGVVCLNADAILSALLGDDLWRVEHRVFPTPPDDEKAG